VTFLSGAPAFQADVPLPAFGGPEIKVPELPDAGARDAGHD
jgi:hypothetical protein